jgi:type VI secretion system VasD/TssJ family lipoprotein
MTRTAHKSPRLVGIPVGWVLLLLLGTTVGLAGCASGPPTYTVYLKGEQDLNRNSSDKSTPVNVRIYQLTDNSYFDAADFDSLWEDDAEALADTVVDVTECVVTTAQDESALVLASQEEVRFIGVVGLFNRQDGPSKQSCPVDEIDDWRFSFVNFRIEKTER